MRTEEAVTEAEGVPIGYATLVVYAGLIAATAWIEHHLHQPKALAERFDLGNAVEHALIAMEDGAPDL